MTDGLRSEAAHSARPDTTEQRPGERSIVASARRSILVPLDMGGRAGAVTDRLREAIFLNVFPGGRPLPSEAVLSSELGVSTKTLRESLVVLRAEGLIETRRGRTGGSFVKKTPGVSPAAVRLRLAGLSASQLRDLSDEHRAVSGTAALLAADRADDDQIALLAERALGVRDASTAVSRGRADTQFHTEVAVAAQSERLMRSEVMLQRDSRDLLWACDSPFDPDQAALDHQRIADAIARQDGDAARALAEEHIMSNYRFLLDKRLEMRRR